MDGLSWEASQLVSSIPNSWSNHQQDLQASFLMSCSNSGAFNSTQELPKVRTSQTCANSSRVNVISQMMELPAATSNIPSVASHRILLQQEGATRLAADNILLEKSGTGTNWVEAFTSQSLPSLPTCMPQKGQQLQVTDGEVLAAAGSLDQSLDCLLSATNSNTGNSVEDDGISLILSDCRNLWSFGNYGSTVSSGESDTNAGNPRKEVPFPLNELDETAVSQCSSDQLINNSKQESKKPYSMKRSHDQVDPYFNVLQNNTSNNTEGCFRLIAENPPKSKKPRSEKRPSSSNINFQQSSNTTTTSTTDQEPDPEAIAQMKEMIYRAAVFRPVNLGLEVVEKPKRKNVRISTDPQTVAARQRRERISERIRVLQRLVPGGSKMDTASMLDEAANYLKFLRSQVKDLESLGQHKTDSLNSPPTSFAFSFNTSFPMQPHFPIQNPSHIHHPQG